MARAFLMAPTASLRIVCPTCEPVVRELANQAADSQVATVSFPCETAGPLDCDACGFPLSQEVTMQ